MEDFVDFGNICRICLTTDDLTTVFNEEIPSFCEMLMACAPIEVCEENGLPTRVCIDCSNELEAAFAFREKCIQTDLKLKKYLDDHGIKTTVSFMHNAETDETIETIQTTVMYDSMSDNIDYESNVYLPETVFVMAENDDEDYKEPGQFSYLTEEHLDDENSNEIKYVNICEDIEEDVPSDGVEVEQVCEEEKIVIEPTPKVYQCQLCDRYYNHPRNLRHHVTVEHSGSKKEIQSGTRNFRCSVCRRIFSFKNALIRHLRVIHKDITRNYFRIKNGKNFCSREIKVFIENTQENTDEVKGILGDLENQPEMSPCSEDDDSTDGLDDSDYNFNSLDNADATIDEVATGLNGPEETIHFVDVADENVERNFSSLAENSESLPLIVEYNEPSPEDEEIKVNDQVDESRADVSAVDGNYDANGLKYDCDLCDKVFGTKSNLKRHLIIVHNLRKKLRSDPDIGSLDTPIGHMIKELKIDGDADNDNDGDNEDGMKRFQCNLCDRSYFAKNNLRRHFKDKHMPSSGEPERDYMCEMCGRAFARRGLLERHKESHFERIAFQCEQCGDIFSNRSKLRLHIVKHNTQKKYQCNVCFKWFLRPATLKVHKRQHDPVLPYPCTECDRAFSMKPALEAHLRTHSEARPYVCDVCRKAFRHPGHLETHVKLHTGERPFACTMCPKRFTTSTHLKYHTKVHLDQRDHKCNVCGKGFIHSSELKYHMISHTHIKERPCPICGKLFGRTNQVTKHLKQVHKFKKDIYKFN